MSATDELRRLLDERGIEHTDFGGMTEWTNGGGRMCRAYTRPEPLTVDVAMLAVPPEQAIAATLGAGECEDVGQAAVFKCSECGWYSPVFTFGEKMPRFCPQCGKAVKR